MTNNKGRIQGNSVWPTSGAYLHSVGRVHAGCLHRLDRYNCLRHANRARTGIGPIEDVADEQVASVFFEGVATKCILSTSAIRNDNTGTSIVTATIDSQSSRTQMPEI